DVVEEAAVQAVHPKKPWAGIFNADIGPRPIHLSEDLGNLVDRPIASSINDQGCSRWISQFAQSSQESVRSQGLGARWGARGDESDPGDRLSPADKWSSEENHSKRHDSAARVAGGHRCRGARSACG